MIKAYFTSLDPLSGGYPFEASICSALGFADEVHVVDACSTDGSLKALLFLKLLAKDRLILHRRPWDRDEPGEDGKAKQFAREQCGRTPGDFLVQMDLDEVVMPRDWPKMREACLRMPADVDVLHLPMLELWGDERTVRSERPSWKWRISRTDAQIEHGIHVGARRFDPQRGRVYAAKGMSDGAEFIISDFRHERFLDHAPHAGPCGEELELLRLSEPAAWFERMVGLWRQWPSVVHYSWADLPRKIRQFRNFWNVQWSTLYNEPVEERFPGVDTEEQVLAKAEELRLRGGEHGPAYTFQLPSDLVPDLASIPPPPWQGEVPPLASQTPWSDEMQRMMRDRIQGIG